jgi:hypothetical protein
MQKTLFASILVVHTVYKHVFKGNKLVKESYRTYRLRDGQNPGAAAFK